jgi:hypothetical protein
MNISTASPLGGNGVERMSDAVVAAIGAENVCATLPLMIG